MLVLSRKKDEQIILKGENFKDIEILDAPIHEIKNKKGFFDVIMHCSAIPI